METDDKSQSYYLPKYMIEWIAKKAKQDSRSASSWLQMHIEALIKEENDNA